MSYMKLKSYRVGEEHIQSNGMNATIIKYNYASDITVEFEDGLIKEHIKYDDFINGRVLHKKNPSTKTKYIQSRIGEQVVNHNNLVMTIVKYRNANDIDVLFEDGVLMEHVRYVSFFQGYLQHPTKKSIRWPYKLSQKLIGMTKRTLDHHYEIIDIHGKDGVDLLDENGTILYNKSYFGMKKGHIYDARE